MNNIQNGKHITLAFQYIQQFFKECQRLIFRIDHHLAPDWRSLYGNRITSEVSASLQYPKDWLPQAIFRAYENSEDGLINKCITITFWEDGIEQPIITAGKIKYSEINNRKYWDLWHIWYTWKDKDEDNKYELDGKVNIFRSEKCSFIDEAYVFSFPLVSITDDETLMEKIIKPLKEL